MGGNTSRYGFINDKATKDMLEGDDIGRRNIRTNYYTLFMFLTIFLIIAAATALGCGIYLATQIYNTHPGKDEELDQKSLIVFMTSLFFAMTVLLSFYYAYYIGRDLKHADILVTDMTRLTTAPLSDASFKANMTNLIANRLGDESKENKTRIFNNLAKSVIVDPIGYLESKSKNLSSGQATAHYRAMDLLGGLGFQRASNRPGGSLALMPRAQVQETTL